MPANLENSAVRSIHTHTHTGTVVFLYISNKYMDKEIKKTISFAITYITKMFEIFQYSS